MLIALAFVLALATPTPAPAGTPAASPTLTPAPCASSVAGSGSGCGGAPVAQHPEPTSTVDGTANHPNGVATSVPLPSLRPMGPRSLYQTWPVMDLGQAGVPALSASRLAEAQRVRAALGLQSTLLMFALPSDTFVLYLRDASGVDAAGSLHQVIGSHCLLDYRVEPGPGELVKALPKPLMKCVETAADRAANG